jgi:hypothetical protein
MGQALKSADIEVDREGWFLGYYSSRARVALGIGMSRMVKSSMRDGGMWGASAGRDKERNIGRGVIAQGEGEDQTSGRDVEPMEQKAQRPQICWQHTKG